MKYRLLLAGVIACSFSVQAQYKNDNKLYQAVFLEDLCKQLQAHPDHILLDVRSQGEYDDTSGFTSLNFGRLKNALHIDVRQLPDRWKELEKYKDKTIFIYCSHSQRSRRASKQLADSGFAHIMNVNGGLTSFYLLKNTQGSCFTDMYSTNTRYKIYNPQEFCTATGNNTFILDVRTDSAFKGIAANEGQNAFGVFKGAVNIPFAGLPASLARVPKNKTIIIVDDYGNDSPKAAQLLLDNGFTSVGILFNGMDEWFSLPPTDLPCKTQLVQRNRKYNLLSGEEFSTLATSDNGAVVVDIRKADEFNNQAKDYWRNVGKIKNAVNFPADQIADHLQELASAKNKPVILYGFSSQGDAFHAAQVLCNNGFTNVNVLKDGIFNLRWRAANIKDKAYLKDWVINIPDINQ